MYAIEIRVTKIFYEINRGTTRMTTLIIHKDSHVLLLTRNCCDCHFQTQNVSSVGGHQSNTSLLLNAIAKACGSAPSFKGKGIATPSTALPGVV